MIGAVKEAKIAFYDQKEKKYVIPFVVFSSLLFVGGGLFGYFIVFPFGFKFFLGFANENVQALPSVKQYFSFAIKLLFAFGVVFELPVVVFFLAKMGLVTPELLRKKTKICHFVNLCFSRHPNAPRCDHPVHDGRASDHFV